MIVAIAGVVLGGLHLIWVATTIITFRRMKNLQKSLKLFKVGGGDSLDDVAAVNPGSNRASHNLDNSLENPSRMEENLNKRKISFNKPQRFSKTKDNDFENPDNFPTQTVHNDSPNQLLPKNSDESLQIKTISAKNVYSEKRNVSQKPNNQNQLSNNATLISNQAHNVYPTDKKTVLPDISQKNIGKNYDGRSHVEQEKQKDNYSEFNDTSAARNIKNKNSPQKKQISRTKDLKNESADENNRSNVNQAFTSTKNNEKDELEGVRAIKPQNQEDVKEKNVTRGSQSQSKKDKAVISSISPSEIKNGSKRKSNLDSHDEASNDEQQSLPSRKKYTERAMKKKSFKSRIFRKIRRL